MVHVLEVFLEEGDVDDFAGGKIRIGEGSSEGFGVSVGAVAWRVISAGESRKRREKKVKLFFC